MKIPELPACESERLMALDALGLLETGREARFERFTRLARSVTGTAIATVSFVDAHRQWFKGMQGLEVAETPRAVSFCGHAILEKGVFYIPDTQADPRFADNPLVVGPPHARFYAGAPLTVPGDHAVGTLCVIDRIPRRLQPEQLRDLRDLADALERELAAHLLLRRIRQMPEARALQQHPTFEALARSD